MTRIRALVSRLLDPFLRRRRERDLADEVEAHLAFLAEEHERDMSPSEARAAARRDFGGIEPMKEDYRAQRGFPFVDSAAQDVRLAIRLLANRPGFATVVVVALALGIGVNNTVFTFVNAASLRGLPTDDPHRIMSLRTADRTGKRGGVSYADYVDWRASTKSFDGLAAHSRTRFNVGDDVRVTEQFPGLYVSADGFRVLGAEPILGRDFVSEDDRIGATPVAILGASLWKSRYDGDRGIVGSTILVNGVPTAVIGVMPDGFAFDYYAAVWQPLALMPGLMDEGREARNLNVVGRLAVGVPLAAAQTELDTIGERLGRDHPETNHGIRPVVGPFTGRLSQDPMTLALMGAAGFVLLIACANVANLLLARSSGRSREIALRMSLGATRWRVVRQLLIESIVLTILAGLVGFGLSVLGVRFFASAVEDIAKPYWIHFSMDGRVFAFLAAICLVTAFAFALAPALFASKANANALKAGGRGDTDGHRARRWTRALLASELAVTLVLLAGAGLMVRSFAVLYASDQAVETSELLTVGVQLPDAFYPTADARLAFFERLEESVRAMPGVASASIASMVPFAGAPMREVTIEAMTPWDDGSQPAAAYIAAGAEYFETLKLGLVRGRAFTGDDGGAGRETAIVNERFVSMYLPEGDPIGQRIRWSDGGVEAPWLTIVGVSRTIRQRMFEPDPAVYIPFRMDPDAVARLLVRSPLATSVIVDQLREKLRSLDPGLALFGIMPAEDLMSQSRWPHRVFGSMASIFGLIALTLSAVGLYAVTAFAVTRRTQEIGVRMALGARRGQVHWMVLRQALQPLVAGFALGTAGALVVGRLLQGMLVDTSPTDSITLVSAGALLTIVSLAACYGPARRATRLDPVEALRHE